MITLIIIGLTVLVSILSFSNSAYLNKLQYTPYLVHNHKQWYRLLSHALVHGDYTHLFFNMFVLYMFGRQVEDNFAYIFGAKGSINFAALYVLGVLFASLPALGKHKNNAYYNAVGASGAVSAVLYASILINPLNEVYMMFLPIPIKSWVFGIGYLALEYYLDKKKSGRIAHDAHYWGALFGFIFTIILKPSLFMDFVAAIRYSLFS